MIVVSVNVLDKGELSDSFFLEVRSYSLRYRCGVVIAITDKIIVTNESLHVVIRLNATPRCRYIMEILCVTLDNIRG